MANDLSANPWVLDTPTPYVPGAGPNQAAVLWRDGVDVNHFELVGYTTGTAQNSVLKNRNGQIVGQLTTSTTDNEEKRTGKVGWINGFCLDTLTSGKILVYLEP